MVLGFLALVSGRELTLTLLAVWQVDLKIVGLIDKVVFFFFGVVGLCIIVLTEGYLRTGAKRAKLPERCDGGCTPKFYSGNDEFGHRVCRLVGILDKTNAVIRVRTAFGLSILFGLFLKDFSQLFCVDAPSAEHTNRKAALRFLHL